MMRTRGFTQKKYHLENNLWVCGFRSACDTYDETMEYYNFQKLHDNPRYKEIITELTCSFAGSYDMIPLEIIGNFAGFEEDDFPKEPGWFLGICAKSFFLEQETAHTKRYNGPGEDWHKDAMIWWYNNESTENYDLMKLAIGYATYAIRRRNKKLIDLCRSQGSYQSISESIIKYIVRSYNPFRLINFIEGMDPMELYFLTFFIDDANFDNYVEHRDSPDPERRERYDYKKHLEIANIIDTEMAKYL